MPLFSDPSVGIADSMLARAFRAAERGRGTVSPNPLVGCVVARDGAVIAEGHHERAGGPHAEIVALDAAGDAASGADVYVTLEPCNHHGLTPPCTERLIAARVASVTIGMADPNPHVTGGGAGALTAAGIRVSWAGDPAPFVRQNDAWLHRLRTGRPFVRVKIALTLDGRPALRPDERSQITGTGGATITMRLRSAATAVAVGARTLAVDDPLLTVREAGGVVASRQPRRVVFARTGVPDPAARMLSDGTGPVTLVVSDTVAAERIEALTALGVVTVRYDLREGLAGALSALADIGVNDVLVEPGPSLLTALWSGRLIDELIVVTAGGMAGTEAPALFAGAADSTHDRLTPVMVPYETGIADGDAVTVWRPGGTASFGHGEGSGT